jgi:hypothetical protein
MNGDRLPVAQRDGPGLIEQQDIHVSAASTARPDMAITFF